MKTYTCKTCNETKTEVIPAITEHVYNQQVTEDAYLLSKATCTTPAEYYYSCICGEKGTETFLYGTVNGHAYDEKWSTSETNHWHAAICEHTDQPSDFGEHTWDSGKATIEATCTSAGRMTYTCTACGRTRTEEVPALPHSFTQKNTDKKYLKNEATCTEPAEYYYSCTCGKMGTETFTDGAAKGHTFDKKWSASETDHWHAAICGHTDVTSDFGAHTWDNGTETQTPTHSASGVKLYTCTSCGSTKTEVLPIIPHSFTEQNTDWKYLKQGATCTTPAEYYYSCICGEQGTEVFTNGSPKEHDWDSGIVVIPATAKTEGSRQYTCKDCGAVKTESIPKIAANMLRVPEGFSEFSQMGYRFFGMRRSGVRQVSRVLR